jgi:hypothetical protein
MSYDGLFLDKNTSMLRNDLYPAVIPHFQLRDEYGMVRYGGLCRTGQKSLDLNKHISALSRTSRTHSIENCGMTLGWMQDECRTGARWRRI